MSDSGLVGGGRRRGKKEEEEGEKQQKKESKRYYYQSVRGINVSGEGVGDLQVCFWPPTTSFMHLHPFIG
jgi:hypothetical protein